MDNVKKIQDIISRFETGVNQNILTAMKRTAEVLVDRINVPIATHNLWDSIGCGIYKDGVLIDIYFPKPEAQVPNEGLWGHEEMQDFIVSNPPNHITTMRGWSLYYVAAMPYAEEVDDRPDGDVLLVDRVVPLLFKYLG